MAFSRSFLILAASGLLAVATGAKAVELTYVATLLGSAEVPPVVTGGTGMATVTVDAGLMTMRVQTTFSGLTGNVTASHIHCCASAAGTAGVATPTPTFPGFPLGATFGSYDVTFDMSLGSSYNAAFITANGGTTNGAFAALLGGLNTSQAYFNIHSTTNGGGEIRGQLISTPVPEPATYAMMALGLALVGGLVRRRKPA